MGNENCSTTELFDRLVGVINVAADNLGVERPNQFQALEIASGLAYHLSRELVGETEDDDDEEGGDEAEEGPCPSEIDNSEQKDDGEECAKPLSPPSPPSIKRVWPIGKYWPKSSNYGYMCKFCDKWVNGPQHQCRPYYPYYPYQPHWNYGTWYSTETATSLTGSRG